jgi:hypothetical protein
MAGPSSQRTDSPFDATGRYVCNAPDEGFPSTHQRQVTAISETTVCRRRLCCHN